MIFLLWFLMTFPLESARYHYENYLTKKRDKQELKEQKRKARAMREGVDPSQLGLLRAHTGFAFSGEAGNDP